MAKPAAGVFTPIEIKDPVVVLVQTLGEIAHERIVSSLDYPTKKGISLYNDVEQSAIFVHFTAT